MKILFMKILPSITVFFISTASYASTGSIGNLLPHVCYFNVPTVHSMQSPGPYVGRGHSEPEARAKALQACKSALDFWVRGACDGYYRDPRRMECVFKIPRH